MTARKYTNKILERIDDGRLHPDFLIQNLLMWMSEHEVKEFYESVISCDDECSYCGGNCPNDEDNACDGYLGDIDDLDKKSEAARDDFNYVGSSQHY